MYDTHSDCIKNQETSIDVYSIFIHAFGVDSRDFFM